MPRSHPLPKQLQHGPFTKSQARKLGISDKRLRSADVVRLGHGLYAAATEECGWPSGFHQPGHGFGLAALVALLRKYPGAVVSHGTAAHVYQLPIPSPARTWVDLASDQRLELNDLIIVADAIVNRPWVDGRRIDGLDTLPGLAATVERAGSPRGIGRARQALASTRVGADSPPETRTRLALVDAGMPEPETQVKADPGDSHSPTADLGYRRWKIAIQYDGGHHRSAQQQAFDAERDAWFQQHGWLVIRLTWRDQQTGFARLISLVRERMAAHAV